MSIKIEKEKCTSCGSCVKICPGKLIYQDSSKKAYIKYPKDCWGCTACLKECRAGAIRYYLGADIGGQGAFLYTKQDKDFLHWVIVKEDEQEMITINRRESNKY